MAQATNEGRTLPAAAPTSRADGIADAITATVGALKRRIEDPEAHTRAFLLGHVARLEPVRATDLAEQVHLDLSTISRHLRGLEESGLLVRSPDSDDRRASRLAVTPEGRVVLDRTTAARTALFTSATAGWTDSEVDELVLLLNRLSHDLENQ
jgi:DNA-binding MarR family transcriptional regulator